MIDLTSREALALWIISNELLTPENVADAITITARKNNCPPELVDRVVESYLSGMKKLHAFASNSVDMRQFLRVIDGGRATLPRNCEGG